MAHIEPDEQPDSNYLEPLDKRVTVRDIAKDVGLHFTTVAEALRGSTRVSSKTRSKVREAAERLGYSADPILAALSKYSGNVRRKSFQGTIAWINGFADEDHFGKSPGFYDDCYLGAKERCHQLGFQLESFWIAAPGMRSKRVSEILTSRNVAGVVIGPLPLHSECFSLSWEKFRSVKIGYSSVEARLTTIKPDHFGNLRFTYERLLKLGFKRIGFACSQEMDDRVNNLWSGAYWAMQKRLNPECILEPHIDLMPEGSSKLFMEWCAKESPEVVVCGGAHHYHRIVSEGGLSVPEDIQLVNLNGDRPTSSFAGVKQNGLVVGMTSVDYLNAAIQRFSIGRETHPREVALAGEWMDGFSLDPSLIGRSK